MIASERKGAESPKVELWNLPALEGKRFQSEVKGRRETPLVHHVVTTVARPGDVELMRMPRHRSGEAELMLPPWYWPGGDELMLPLWQGPVILPPRYGSGKVVLVLPPWPGPVMLSIGCPPRHRPGEGKLMLSQWHRPGEDELLLPPWHRPGEVEQVLPAWHRHRPMRLSRSYRRGQARQW
jgi:hypothetical protein